MKTETAMQLFNDLPLVYLDANFDDEGISRISLVDRPAVEKNFIALSKDYKLVKNDANHTIYGVLLMPDQPIYRRDSSGKEYYIAFSKGAVENLASKLIRDGSAVNVDTNHNQKDITDGSIYPISIWVTNSKIEKIEGFEDVPDGSLMIEYKVTSESLFNEITTDYKGFSIEAVLSPELYAPKLSAITEDERIEAEKLYSIIKHLK